MGVVIKEALANGRLTSRNQDPAFYSKRMLLETTAIEMKATIDSVALAAVLAQPWADVVLSGATTAEQLRSNVRALDIEWTDEIAERLTALQEPSAEYWSTRSRLPWN
jgi:aryl-alcohol dehydrogenase-like predicted oxidoreductase